MKKHTISLLVENKFGAFDRVATMFSAKGFRLRSITIGETEVRDLARMTIVTTGDEQVVDQVVKQLNRLVDTVKVRDLTDVDSVEREMALIKVNYQKHTLDVIKNICDIFRGIIVDINNRSMMIEMTGPPDKINAAVNVLMPYGIVEMARSGVVALRRGEQMKQLKDDLDTLTL